MMQTAKKILSVFAAGVAALAACAVENGVGHEAVPKSLASGNLPLYFEANRGQAGEGFQFFARGRGCNFFVAPTEAVLTLTKFDRGAAFQPATVPPGLRPVEFGNDSQAAGNSEGRRDFTRPEARSTITRTLRFEFLNANPRAPMNGDGELPGKANYFLGDDPSQWRTAVPLFEQVRVAELYNGVDLIYYGNQHRLEYDFTVAPKADARAIRIRFTGADGIRVDAKGDLVFTLGSDEIRQPKPVIYQTVGGARKEIAGGYRLLADHTVAFHIGDYDHELPLVIDPVLSYSRFFGGSGMDTAWAVAVDTNGAVYIAGETMSASLATPGTFQTNIAGSTTIHGDAFVAKFNNTASNLIYMTYLGGRNDDVALSIAVDAAGSAYVTGYTDSTNFPRANPIFNFISGTPYTNIGIPPIDAFVTKLAPSGSNLIYSTYLGGSGRDEGVGIAIDSAGNAYVAGYTESADFPTTNAILSLTNYGGNGDAFVAKIGLGGTNLIYSLYLGGTNLDAASDVAVNADGFAYVAGFTVSTNFPVSANFPAFAQPQTQLAGGHDAFVTIVGTNSTIAVTNLLSSYLGGGGDNAAYRIALDSDSNFYLTGSTTGDSSFPIKPGPLNPGGIFRSDNAASTWTNSSSGLASIEISALAIDPTTPAKLYAGTARGFVRSVDSGVNWTPAVSASSTNPAPAIFFGTVLSLAIDPAAPATLYAGTAAQGVFKSLDSGVTWSASNTGLVNQVVTALAVDAITPATVYAGTVGGVFKSTNGGAFWSASTNGLANLLVNALALHPAAAGTLYAATAGGVYLSTNGAATWNSLNSGLSNLFVHAIAINPTAPTTLYAGTAGGVFRSTNGGINWNIASAGLTVSNVTALAIDPLTPTTLYAGTTNGLFKTLDAATSWTIASNGLPVQDILSLAVNPQSPAALYTGTRGVSFFGGKDAFVFKSGSDGYSVVFGGSSDDDGWDIAVDSVGHAHVVGIAGSLNFPTNHTFGFLRATNAGGYDAFVAELSEDGGAFVQSAYLGGTNADFGYGIALDAGGNSYLVGETFSTNFPTLGPSSAFAGVRDAFLAKIVGDGQPSLEITHANQQVKLSWPAYWPEFAVQTATNFFPMAVVVTNAANTNEITTNYVTAADWNTLTNAPVQANGDLNVTLGDTNSARFFRLRR